MTGLCPLYWVNNLDPFLLRIHGEFGVRYYGLAYALAFLAGWGILKRLSRTGFVPNMAGEESSALAVIFAGAVIGGRAGYFLLYAPADLWRDPLSFFRVWEGGMASHGGFAGVFLAAWWQARRLKIPFLKLTDAAALLTPPGLFFGRLANFINGELWGRPSRLPWAVLFPKSEMPETPLAAMTPRHPSQIYEALLEGVVLGAFIYGRFRFLKGRPKAGRLSAEFLIAYAILRTIGEYFRDPDASLILGLHRGVFYSLFFLLIALAILVATGFSRDRNP